MRGVPLLMYSRISSSSPPKVSRDNTGPYCRVRCWTTVWQTPQDWLKRRNPSRWVSLNEASGGAPCAEATDADATTNAAAKTPRGICRSSDCLQPSYELDCANLTPWGGGVEGCATQGTRANCATPGAATRPRRGFGARISLTYLRCVIALPRLDRGRAMTPARSTQCEMSPPDARIIHAAQVHRPLPCKDDPGVRGHSRRQHAP